MEGDCSGAKGDLEEAGGGGDRHRESGGTGRGSAWKKG